MSNSSYHVRRGSETWRRRYQGVHHNVPAALGAGPVCDHDPGACSVAELWPMPGESDEQFKARLTAKYGRLSQEAH